MEDLSYNYTPAGEGKNRHIWSVVGPAGGVHIWAQAAPDGFTWEDRYYGGVEVHSRTPMYGDGPPHHEKCWLLDAPCWRDGSSLWFSENVAPMLRDEPFPDGIHEYIRQELADWYRNNLERRETEDA